MSPSVSQLVDASKSLTIAEQLELFEALWGLIDEHSTPNDFELTTEQRAELNRRWQEYRLHPETAVNWNEGKSRLAALREARRPGRHHPPIRMCSR